MNQFNFKLIKRDGSGSIGRLTFGNIIIETPAGLPSLRTSKDPDDLEFLVNIKEQYPLDHIQGGVIRLYNAPTILEPKVKIMKEIRNLKTIDNKPSPLDPFSAFYLSNLVICDPVMEYTRLTKTKYDDKFVKNLWFVSRLERYFKEFEQCREIEKKKKSPETTVVKLRQEMHDELWLGNNKSDRKERNAMVEQIVYYQLANYSACTPVCFMVKTVDELKIAIELNELCQALADVNETASLSYIPFHSSAIKNKELLHKYLDYLRTNKTKVNAIKFRDLDLHCPVDFRARNNFRWFTEELIKVKQDKNDKAMMLFDAGTQYYVAMQAFEIINTSLTGFDHDVDGGNRKKGEPLVMHWWDERKMWSRPTDGDAPLPNPDHCPYCNLTTDFNIEEKILNRRRRGHRLFDLNNDASKFYKSVEGKTLGFEMRKRVANAEFSYANDLILSP